jgi:hypothetical protein
VNPYQDYMNQLVEHNRQLRQEMFTQKPGSRDYIMNQREIKANIEEIETMKKLMETDLTLMEKTL